MKNINPFLWFDDGVEEAVNFYVSSFASAFETSRKEKETNISATSRYGDAMPHLKGKVMTVNFKLLGEEFIALNGGPVKDFTFNPSFSFFVSCKTEDEVNKLFKKISDGGEIRMPLDKYPFSERFAWLDDKYGISWQINLSGDAPKINPFLWFDNKAEEAMNYYTSLFSSLGNKSSEIKKLSRFGVNENGPMGKVQHAVFSLNGQEYMAMDSSPFKFSPAASLFINCDTQKEVDILWDKLLDGGNPMQCGWLTDKFGVTWQVVPTILMKLMSDQDKKKATRVMQEMMKMVKIESNDLIKAYEEV